MLFNFTLFEFTFANLNPVDLPFKSLLILEGHVEKRRKKFSLKSSNLKVVDLRLKWLTCF